MKKLTIEQMRKEIYEVNEEFQDLIDKTRYLNPEIFKANQFTIKELISLWKTKVNPVRDRTTPRRDDMVEAHKMAKAILAELKKQIKLSQ